MQEEVYREYGIAGAPTANYEVDYLVTPGLGGAGDIRNLWPEPHYNTVWNSYVKDHLEDHLHYLVCSRQISLVAAQQDMETNWIAAYEKYFHTDKPLTNYAAISAAESNATPNDVRPTARYLKASMTWDDGRRSGRLSDAHTPRKLIYICSVAFLPGLLFLLVASKYLPFRQCSTSERYRTFLASICRRSGMFEVLRPAQIRSKRSVRFVPTANAQCVSPVKSL
jgi:hypothetical protein